MNNQNFCHSDNPIHNDLMTAKKFIYDPCNMIISTPVAEPESAEYAAFAFTLNGFNVRFRSAKITPTKIGQFVTCWKRSVGGPIQPFDVSDRVDFFVIAVRSGENFGQFVFPKSILCEQNVISINSKGGKRAIRVYPPWDETTSKQAKKTQDWQLNYFLEIPKNKPINHVKANLLYSSH